MFRFFKRKDKSESAQSQSKQETENAESKEDQKVHKSEPAQSQSKQETANAETKEGQKVDREKEMGRIQKRGLELRDITIERINNLKGYKEPAPSEMGMVPLIYLTTDDYCYTVLKAGLDFPTIDDYASEEAKIADGYFPINNGFYMHGAFIVQFDLNVKEVLVHPDFEADMKKHLRGADVIDKLDSFRVKGKPAGWYRIKAENVDKIILAIEALQRTRSN